MQLQQIETELKKLQELPAWGTKQTDDWDKHSNFVYDLPTYNELMSKLSALSQGQAFNDYVINRWFNTLSAQGVEQIFCRHSGVLAHKNKYDKLVDFTVHGINFDHKTSVFPKGFGKTLAEAQANPLELIHWLYQYQSRQGRFHTDNRLFLVLHQADGKHWQLRREFSMIQPIIASYLQDFDKTKLHKLSLEEGKTTLSDIIWVCR
jgi:hypothetical protein